MRNDISWKISAPLFALLIGLAWLSGWLPGVSAAIACGLYIFITACELYQKKRAGKTSAAVEELLRGKGAGE